MERIRKATEAERDARGSFNALTVLLAERVALGTLRAFGYAPQVGGVGA